MEDKQVIMIAIAAFALGWWLKSQQKKEGYTTKTSDVYGTRGLEAGQAMAKTGTWTSKSW
jgi:hypothetical protein